MEPHRRRDRGPEPRGRRAHPAACARAPTSPTAGWPRPSTSPSRCDRPLLLEGEPGVGKTEIARVLAAVLGRRLIRLQCYEGIDTHQALYEWDYARQLLAIRALGDAGGSVTALYGPEFLLERPLLHALRAGADAVLLIDEIDRADDEFEAFLLEMLSDFQITIPEVGTVIAPSPPLVVLTSNRTRELHDALKRRCLYHWIDYPSAEREIEIVTLRQPGVRARAGPPGRRRGPPAARAGAGQTARRGGDDRLGAHPRPASASTTCPPTPPTSRSDRCSRSGRTSSSRASASRRSPRLIAARARKRCQSGRFSDAATSRRDAGAVKGMVPVLVGFGRALRDEGLAVGPGDVATYCAAAATLDPTDLTDLYWAGRATLVSRRDDLAAYDEVFHRVLPRREAAGRRGAAAHAHGVRRGRRRRSRCRPSTPAARTRRTTSRPRWASSPRPSTCCATGVRRTAPPTSCAPCGASWRGCGWTPPRRRTRRNRPSARGRRPGPAPHRRDSLRLHGDPVPLRQRERRGREPRPLVLILDVSGSMADHSRALLQFAWSARRAVVTGGGVLLRHPAHPRHACAARRSPDRRARRGRRAGRGLGRRHRASGRRSTVRARGGRRGVARGGVVVICSDGMDRGDPDLLAAAMERLSRQCRRIVWCTPHGPGSSWA